MTTFHCIGQGSLEFIARAFSTRKSFLRRSSIRLASMIGFAFCSFAVRSLYATVTMVSVQYPWLNPNGTTQITSPVHFQATAESDMKITGYVVYVDGQNVFQNFTGSLDAWIVVPPGNHSLYVKAWDSGNSIGSTPTYSVNTSGYAPPVPPASAMRLQKLSQDASLWTVDNAPGVGGQCNDGYMGTFDNASDPNTGNSPDAPHQGLHLMLTSKCQYDDSLFYRKNTIKPYPFAKFTNFLWDFWFYIPTTTLASTIQALEFDFFQAVELSDGVHEFMFGSQCNYVTNQWQFWLPGNGKLTWTNSGITPCQFSSGAWHHATYFLQRVTASGYQKIPTSFAPSSDPNNSLRFGTLTIDGNTAYLGMVSNSTIPQPQWSQTLGIQHQLDSSKEGVTLEEYVDKETVTLW